MLQLQFTKEEIERLSYERYHHPHPRVQKKMEVLYLKSQRLSHQTIKQLARISENTLLKYLRAYQAGRIEKLKEIHFRSPQSALTTYAKTLETHFLTHPPTSLNQAAQTIKELTGVSRSPGRVRVFLKRMGLQRRQVGMVPAKADVEQQDQFRCQELEPRIAQAKAGQRTLFL